MNRGFGVAAIGRMWINVAGSRNEGVVCTYIQKLTDSFLTLVWFGSLLTLWRLLCTRSSRGDISIHISGLLLPSAELRQHTASVNGKWKPNILFSSIEDRISGTFHFWNKSMVPPQQTSLLGKKKEKESMQSRASSWRRKETWKKLYGSSIVNIITEGDWRWN